MLGGAQDAFGIADFYESARLHYGDACSQLRHHRQAVGDEDVG
jgi:hypothetical protein